MARKQASTHVTSLPLPATRPFVRKASRRGPRSCTRQRLAALEHLLSVQSTDIGRGAPGRRLAPAESGGFRRTPKDRFLSPHLAPLFLDSACSG